MLAPWEPWELHQCDASENLECTRTLHEDRFADGDIGESQLFHQIGEGTSRTKFGSIILRKARAVQGHDARRILDHGGCHGRWSIGSGTDELRRNFTDNIDDGWAVDDVGINCSGNHRHMSIMRDQPSTLRAWRAIQSTSERYEHLRAWSAMQLRAWSAKNVRAWSAIQLRAWSAMMWRAWSAMNVRAWSANESEPGEPSM